jgi:hypothetical protein
MFYHYILAVKKSFLTFQVLTAASMKMTVFWNVAQSSLVELDRRFRRAYCLHYQDNYLHTRRRDNLKSHTLNPYGDATLHSSPWW